MAQYWTNTTAACLQQCFVQRSGHIGAHGCGGEFRLERQPALIARIGQTNFTARWTGSVQPQYDETYTFTTVADDGVRLWVNGSC